MNDNALITAVATVIQAGLTARSITVGMKQNYQPTQEGTPAADTVFIHKLGDNRYGYVKRKDVFDKVGLVTIHTESVWYETSYQVTALAKQNPANQTQLTAADYVKSVAGVLQSDTARVALSASGIGIYRIQDIKQSYFKDDRGQYEASPILEFTVTHCDVSTEVVPSTLTIVETIRRI